MNKTATLKFSNYLHLSCYEHGDIKDLVHFWA